jgi:hypothetical protein
VSKSRWSALLAGLVFAAIVIGSVDLRFVRLLFHDRAILKRAFALPPAARRAPGYDRFLSEVAGRVERGRSVAVVMPKRWESGYAYAYYRASYVLAGRRVIPLVDPDSRVRLERIEGADYVAAWGAEVEGLEPLWSGSGGTLYRGPR